MRKKLLLIIISVILITLSTSYAKWISYLYHLASFQISSIIKREPLDNIKWSQLTELERNNLKRLKSIRNFAESAYKLKNSHSFTKAVRLHQKDLGYNLTMAYPLDLKPLEFYFPFIGSFSYLGFFDSAVLSQWISRFQSKGYDIHKSIIAAYSTLGYFEDPLYSTYLSFPKKDFTSLILHEMAHEKLYFSDDSSFSEQLASFIEEKATHYYLVNTEQNHAHEKPKRKKNNALNFLLELKNKLDNLYKSNISRPIKLILKSEMILNSKRDFIKSVSVSDKTHYKNWLKHLPEINNAFLIQIQRYNPQVNGFNKLFLACHKNFSCWFDSLSKLKNCSVEKRSLFLKKEISLQKQLKVCQQK